MYDYTAADTDEVRSGVGRREGGREEEEGRVQVSFLEGDVIVDCQFVDEGWMTGTVQRTKGWGMLPANYVEKVM